MDGESHIWSHPLTVIRSLNIIQNKQINKQTNKQTNEQTNSKYSTLLVEKKEKKFEKNMDRLIMVPDLLPTKIWYILEDGPLSRTL